MMNAHAALLTSLPCEMKQRVASFLSPIDALNLSLVCKSLHSCLSLAVLPPLPFFPKRRWSQWHRIDGDKRYESFRIPILHPRTHSIRVSLLWNDQGHGDHQGQIWIVGRPESETETRDLEKAFDGGRVVSESPTAPHAQSRLEIDFSPSDGEMYHLWYKIGSGGIRVLTIHEGSVRALIFDDHDHNFAKNFRKLVPCGVLSRLDQEAPCVPEFYTKLLLCSCKSLRQQLACLEQPDESLVYFFQEHDIAVTEKSLAAVEEIIEAEMKVRLDIKADNKARSARREKAEVRERSFFNRQGIVLDHLHIPEEARQPPRWMQERLDLQQQIRRGTVFDAMPIRIPEHARQPPRWMPANDLELDDMPEMGPFEPRLAARLVVEDRRTRERDEHMQRRVRRRLPIRLGWNAIEEAQQGRETEQQLHETM